MVNLILVQFVLAFLVLLITPLSANSWAANYGSITAVSASKGGGMEAYFGFSSGAVAACFIGSDCRFFAGTPNSPVTAMDSDADPDGHRVWVGYENGDAYLCFMVSYTCRLRGGLQPTSPNPSPPILD